MTHPLITAASKMREAAAKVADAEREDARKSCADAEKDRDIEGRAMAVVAACTARDIAAAIRALPLPEAAPDKRDEALQGCDGGEGSDPANPRKYYNKASAALNAAHLACFDHPDRPALGMSHGPFSGVNEALGIVSLLETQNNTIFGVLAKLRVEIDKRNEALEKAAKEFGNLIHDVQEWCDAVERDSSWDGWDDHYKGLSYGNLEKYRADLTAALAIREGER